MQMQASETVAVKLSAVRTRILSYLTVLWRSVNWKKIDLSMMFAACQRVSARGTHSSRALSVSKYLIMLPQKAFSKVSSSNLVRMVTRSVASSSRRAGKLDGKVAVVTASTEGIGYAIAKKLGQDGAKVVISSRKQKNVDKALEELKSENLTVCGMVCHVGKAEHRKALMEKAVAEYGGIDILVSNAAVNPYFGTLATTPEEAFDKIMEVNVKAAFMLVKETVPYMEKRGQGSILFVSSIGGLVPFPMLGAYSVSKTALLGMTKAFAAELAPSNIRVNCLAPGIIKTKFSGALWQSEEQKKLAESSNPMNRIGEPDECAGAASFLSSDDASYITGETMVIAGGSTSRL